MGASVQKGADWRTGGQAHKRTTAPSGQADRRTSGQGRTMGGHANEGGLACGRANGRADRRMGWRTGGRGRTVDEG